MAIQSFQEAIKNDNTGFEVFTYKNNKDEHTHQGFFANIRINRKTVPEGWHVYDIREDDNKGYPCEIRNGYVMVNHLGTFATKDPLPLKPNESLFFNDGKIKNPKEEFDYSFT